MRETSRYQHPLPRPPPSPSPPLQPQPQPQPQPHPLHASQGQVPESRCGLQTNQHAGFSVDRALLWLRWLLRALSVPSVLWPLWLRLPRGPRAPRALQRQYGAPAPPGPRHKVQRACPAIPVRASWLAGAAAHHLQAPGIWRSRSAPKITRSRSRALPLAAADCSRRTSQMCCKRWFVMPGQPLAGHGSRFQAVGRQVRKRTQQKKKRKPPRDTRWVENPRKTPNCHRGGRATEEATGHDHLRPTLSDSASMA